MHHAFSCTLRTRQVVDPNQLADTVRVSLATLPNVTVVEVHVLPRPTTDASLEDYATKLERLSATLAFVAHDYGGTSPYGATLTRLKQHGIRSAADRDALAKLETLSRHAPMLARMRRFLVELPESEKYAHLRFLRQLVAANLDLPSIAANPARLDGQALRAFEEYHTEYVRLYRHHCTAYTDALQSAARHRIHAERLLAALTAFDQLRALGAPVATILTRELIAWSTHHPPLAIDEQTLIRTLAIQPTIGHITLTTPLPTTTLEPIVTRIETAYTEKLHRLTEASTLAILAHSDDPIIRKLTRLLTLANVEKIAMLFTPKTTPKLIAALATLLGNTSADTLSFGDFTPTVHILESTADVKTIEREFHTWLAQKRKAHHTLTIT